MIKLKDLFRESMNSSTISLMIKRIKSGKKVASEWGGKPQDAKIVGNKIKLSDGTTILINKITSTEFFGKGSKTYVRVWTDEPDPNLSDRPGDHKGWNR